MNIKIKGQIILANEFVKTFSIKLYLLGSNEKILLDKTISCLDGKFKFCIDKKYVGQILYICSYKDTKYLLNVFELQNENNFVVVNELSTIATIYTFNNFFNNHNIIIPDISLKFAFGMKENLVKKNGKLSEIILSNPNGNETNALRTLNSMANLLISICTEKYVICKLKKLINEKNFNTIQIIRWIVNNPLKYKNEIFTLSTMYNYNKPFLLPEYFSSWVIGLKFNKSGSNEKLIGGPGNLDFTSDGTVWVTNNVIQGTTISGDFACALQPNGLPKNFSPLTGGGLLGQGFGINTNNDKIFFGNFGWGGVNPPSGSISIFNTDGNPLSPETGFVNETYRVQGVVVDNLNNLWMCSNGNNKVVVYINSNPSNNVVLQLPDYSSPFDIACDKNNNIFVSISGDSNKNVSSKLFKLHLNQNNDTIIVDFELEIGKKLLGVCVNSKNEIYVNSNEENSVYKISNNGEILKKFTEGIFGPWGNCVDSNDNLYIANFEPNHINKYCFTCYDYLGNLISSLNGIILETGGDEVLLSNGEPLYGNNIFSKCFLPMMRGTGVKVDSAGNLWFCNNWKPNFIVDVLSNPGGDGLIVFLGIASPVIKY